MIIDLLQMKHRVNWLPARLNQLLDDATRPAGIILAEHRQRGNLEPHRGHL